MQWWYGGGAMVMQRWSSGGAVVVQRCFHSIHSPHALCSLCFHPSHCALPTHLTRAHLLHTAREWWCSDGVLVVQWWCIGDTLLVQWWCSCASLLQSLHSLWQSLPRGCLRWAPGPYLVLARCVSGCFASLIIVHAVQPCAWCCSGGVVCSAPGCFARPTGDCAVHP